MVLQFRFVFASHSCIELPSTREKSNTIVYVIDTDEELLVGHYELIYYWLELDHGEQSDGVQLLELDNLAQ